jgi:thiazole synthase ThiGH ThiG subunit
MVLFGLLYRAFPALATSKLAAVHFILFNLGAVVFLVGIPLAQAHQTVAFAAGGSLTVLAGMLTFLANYLVNAFSGSASVRART